MTLLFLFSPWLRCPIRAVEHRLSSRLDVAQVKERRRQAVPRAVLDKPHRASVALVEVGIEEVVVAVVLLGVVVAEDLDRLLVGLGLAGHVRDAVVNLHHFRGAASLQEVPKKRENRIE